jgi:hypothetical protein
MLVTDEGGSSSFRQYEVWQSRLFSVFYQTGQERATSPLMKCCIILLAATPQL